MFEEFKDDIGFIILGAASGLIGLLARQKHPWRDVVVGTAGSALSGITAAKLCTGIGINPDLTFAVVSVAGWIGAAAAMEAIKKMIEKRLGG